MLYVSSAEDAEADQVLEEVMVGPVPVGVNKFVLQVLLRAASSLTLHGFALRPCFSPSCHPDLVSVSVMGVSRMHRMSARFRKKTSSV